jgi:hypothetical protein
MRLTTVASATLLVISSTAPAVAKHAKAAFQLKTTSWTFTGKDGTKVRESIDSDGNFVAESQAGKHLDHGTAKMKGGKACFTSAMTKEGETCWTTAPVAIGHSITTRSDKGEKLRVTRVKYAALKIPG